MNAMFIDSRVAVWLILLAGLLILSFPLHAAESSSENDTQVSSENNAQVMKAFAPEDDGESSVIPVDNKTKEVVMFVMGVPLLILLLVTGVLGIAMGVYGKEVFLAHMICAGLSMTLAIAHAIVGLVWFYPF